MKKILAIDFGGTKTAVGLCDSNGNVLDSITAYNAKSMDAEEVFASVGAPIRSMFEKYSEEIAVCGVSAAGPTRNNGELFTPPNTLAWVDFPLLQRIRDIVGDIVVFENDANALALGEGLKGAARGEQNYMSMVVSTGIGGGLVVDGRLLHGNDRNAGEIGHTIIDVNGPQCGFGCYGCIEAIASGPALEKKFGISPKEATDEMKIYCAENVAQMIINVVSLLDIRLVTIGGSVALGFGDIFFRHCQSHFDYLRKVPFAKGVQIVPSELGKQGGIIGAAAVGAKAIEDNGVPGTKTPTM